MSPLIFINGVILASSAAITLGLAITLFLVVLLGDESPRLAAEFRPLLEGIGLFAVMTAASTASFVGLIRKRPWRWPAVGIMSLVLAALARYFWPA